MLKTKRSILAASDLWLSLPSLAATNNAVLPVPMSVCYPVIFEPKSSWMNVWIHAVTQTDRQRVITVDVSDLRVKLLFSSSMAVRALIAVVTLRWIAPFITMFHTWTRCRPTEHRDDRLSTTDKLWERYTSSIDPVLFSFVRMQNTSKLFQL